MQLQRLFALSLAFGIAAILSAPQVQANPYQSAPSGTYLDDGDDKPADQGEKKDKDSDDQDNKKDQQKDDSDKDKGGDN